jgi:glycosyltransferase involved in cell wall biosynthesis
MMNESHAGTEQSGVAGRWVKRALLRLFDAALVGGEPHRRHFAALGMAAGRLFTGYDAVDNDYFQNSAAAARANEVQTRRELPLPGRYLLNLGRMVRKKNLGVLVRAFATAKKNGLNADVRLVLVGSGEEEFLLKALCEQLELSWQEVFGSAGEAPAAEVLFYGFRQIDQNPSFYALADCFVLPSLFEEWGLVVNEAMACGLPVLVSNTVGCAEDLVVEGQNGFTFDPDSENELAQRLVEVCTDSEKRCSMGKESARIIEKWGCDEFAKNAILAARTALGLPSKGERSPEVGLRHT